MNELQQYLELATTLAKTVGARISEITESADHELKITKKGLTDLVTEIDVWSEETIEKAVGERFPSHVFVGEESCVKLLANTGQKLPQLLNENICWVVDPLDGTTNFSNKIPYSAVSIAVVDHGTPVVGVILDPHRNELFTAVKGQGAFLNGRPIAASAKEHLVDCVVATGFPYDRRTNWDKYMPVIQELIMSARNVRSFGAAAIDLCWIACGRFDGFLEFNLKPWDVAAGAIIIEEAGGRGHCFEGDSGTGQLELCARAFLFSGPNIFEQYKERVASKYINTR
jgi:myo-inositol-1(or 4)-monophosphatase